jgi:hypothetical protein
MLGEEERPLSDPDGWVSILGFFKRLTKWQVCSKNSFLHSRYFISDISLVSNNI